MSGIDYLSHNKLCMRSEMVDHDRKLEWTIAGISKFKFFSPFKIPSKEFKLSPDCKFKWELSFELFIQSIVIKISRKDELNQLTYISRSISFQNSEGVIYEPVVTGHGVEVDGKGTSKQLVYCKLTEDCFPLKLPNDELTVKIYLKQSRCCLITKEVEYTDTYTASDKNGRPRDFLRGLQNLELPLTDITLEVGDTLIPCHKYILCIRSTFFKKMLEDGKLENNSVTKLEDMDLEVCQGLMAYIYTNEISSVTPEAVLELYNVGGKYQVDGLQDKCKLKIVESINEKNVRKAFKLMKASSEFIAED